MQEKEDTGGGQSWQASTSTGHRMPHVDQLTKDIPASNTFEVLAAAKPAAVKTQQQQAQASAPSKQPSSQPSSQPAPSYSVVAAAGTDEASSSAAPVPTWKFINVMKLVLKKDLPLKEVVKDVTKALKHHNINESDICSIVPYQGRRTIIVQLNKTSSVKSGQLIGRTIKIGADNQSLRIDDPNTAERFFTSSVIRLHFLPNDFPVTSVRDYINGLKLDKTSIFSITREKHKNYKQLSHIESGTIRVRLDHPTDIKPKIVDLSGIVTFSTLKSLLTVVGTPQRCIHCRDFGHAKKECLELKSTCIACLTKGHSAAKCPTHKPTAHATQSPTSADEAGAEDDMNTAPNETEQQPGQANPAPTAEAQPTKSTRVTSAAAVQSDEPTSAPTTASSIGTTASNGTTASTIATTSTSTAITSQTALTETDPIKHLPVGSIDFFDYTEEMHVEQMTEQHQQSTDQARQGPTASFLNMSAHDMQSLCEIIAHSSTPQINVDLSTCRATSTTLKRTAHDANSNESSYNETDTSRFNNTPAFKQPAAPLAQTQSASPLTRKILASTTNVSMSAKAPTKRGTPIQQLPSKEDIQVHFSQLQARNQQPPHSNSDKPPAAAATRRSSTPTAAQCHQQQQQKQQQQQQQQKQQQQPPKNQREPSKKKKKTVGELLAKTNIDNITPQAT